ncbi:uncharacterized protein LOC128991310 isoform X1 [Macrosteles quadrilineatus]|uniref:uncharacterized protein LOC128991310 isoform X1 n=1 Tax=Macrosteles quadrilineatus TaxID=74068 RepID=UPI0023E33A90|nr:uncharacterized protein LOC128991310 isoform X1 [Macrosteles quadrilineatus]
MKKEHCYTFIVNEWIDITAANIPEVFVEPLQLTALTTWSSKFMNHLKYGFCYNHLWIAMVLSHPRDPVRRASRLMIGIIFILTSVSASLILTVFSEGENPTQSGTVQKTRRKSKWMGFHAETLNMQL